MFPEFVNDPKNFVPEMLRGIGDRMAFEMADRGISVGKNYVGEYCTSLDMAGAWLTLVKLDDELVRLLEAPAEAAVPVF